MLLHRAVGIRAFGVETPDELRTLVGRSGHDPGFMSSTTTDLTGGFVQHPKHPGKNVHLEIEAPTGTQMLTTRGVAVYENEREILLDAGTRYQVRSITFDDDGTPVVRVRVIV